MKSTLLIHEHCLKQWLLASADGAQEAEQWMTSTASPERISAKKYRAFISYSHKDTAWAKWLHEAIETYRVPPLAGPATRPGLSPKRLRPVFRDREELSATSSLSAAIQAALNDSDYLVVICSPAAKASAWVNEEILFFQRLGLEDRIICFLASGDPPTSFPRALIEAKGSEPLAADARTGHDGRHLAKLKIIAALLGVPLDDLRRRERRYQRKVRQLTACAILAAAVGLIVIYAGLCDAGAPVPGRSKVQTLIDRRNASIFRAVPSPAKIQTTVIDERRMLIDRTIRELRSGVYEFDIPADSFGPARKGIDTWSLGQAIGAILKAPESSQDDLAEALRWLLKINQPEWRREINGVKYGWESWEGRGYTMAPPLLWDVIALTEAAAKPGLLDTDQKKKVLDALQWAQEAAMTYHPRDDGGWNVYPNERDVGAHDTYSAVMALKALLAVKEADFQWTSKPGTREHLIVSTRMYLLSHFERTTEEAGWSSDVLTKNHPLDGLYWESMAVLLQAEKNGYGALPDEIERELRNRLVELHNRPFTFPLSSSGFYRIFKNERGQEFNVKNATLFLWYPCSVQSCARWLDRAKKQPAAPEDVVQIRRSLGHLTLDLRPELLEEGKSGEPFRVSESLYNLSSVGL